MIRGVSVLILMTCVSVSSVAAGGETGAPAPAAIERRPRIGLALGGGGARGLAHVGVVRWLEEHRVPIDLIAGTSMGGLVGGAIASGLSSEELTQVLQETDWDEMFGFSAFRYKNVRRKEDARAYQSRVEIGTKHGIALAPALNSGQQVELLLARMVGPVVRLETFDDLPTPFRAVAVDLVTAQQVVLASGSLPSAMRATMSLPGLFPPVERDGQVLIDGGMLNSVPADIARAMGADVVIAVNVGFMGERRIVRRSMFGLVSQPFDVMVQASARTAMKSADIVINPPLVGFGSGSWRRSRELAAQGYSAAEAMKDQLLPLAIDETQWTAYRERRRALRRTLWPAPQFLSVAGAAPSDRARIEEVLGARVGQPLDVQALETDLETFAGLDRYETVGWELVEENGRPGLRVEAREKSHAPPFLMLAMSLQNTTSDDFAFQLAARYLTFDFLASGSELRVDGAVGDQPSIGVELYQPLGGTALFVAGDAGVRRGTQNFVTNDNLVARYHELRALVGFDIGVNLMRDSDVRLGMSLGRLDTTVDVGAPGLPEVDGREMRARLQWRYDGQDSPAIPSHGTRAIATLSHILDAPDLPDEFPTNRTNDDVTQVDARVSVFRSLRRRSRLFLAAGLGTSWRQPLANEQFQMGAPLRLGAYDVGELRGDHYAVLTTGYLRGVGRLPDFLGGPVFLGGWVENGSVSDDLDAARVRTNVSLGGIADTLIGPAILGGSLDFHGEGRYYIGVGRLF